jgi:hypothetical protein
MDIFGRGPVHHTPGAARATEPAGRTGLGRAGGKRKGYDVRVHPGMTDNQIAQAGTKHLISDAVVDPGTSLNLKDSSQMGKRLPIPMMHSAMRSRSDRGSYDPKMANAVMGEATFSGSTRLPGKVSEN